MIPHSGSITVRGVLDALEANGIDREFAKPKIFWPEFSLVPNFAVDQAGFYSTNKAFFVIASDPFAQKADVGQAIKSSML